MNIICRLVTIILLNFLHGHTCNSILRNHDIIEIQTFEQTLMENYSLKKYLVPKKQKSHTSNMCFWIKEQVIESLYK